MLPCKGSSFNKAANEEVKEARKMTSVNNNGLVLDAFEKLDEQNVSFRYFKGLHVRDIPFASEGLTLVNPLGGTALALLPSSTTQAASSKEGQSLVLRGASGVRIEPSSAFCEVLILHFSNAWVDQAIVDNLPVVEGLKLPPRVVARFSTSKWYSLLMERYRFERLLCRTSQLSCTFFLEKQIINELFNIIFESNKKRAYRQDLNLEDTETQPSDFIFKRLLEFLAQNIHQKISLADMERFSGYSRTELVSQFKMRLDISPVAFFTRLKLEEARVLIESGRLSANAASQVFGYSEPAAFRHAFKRQFGRSPVAPKKV